jgi:hypothetical protein
MNRVFALLIFAVAVSACSDSTTTTPTTPTTTTAGVTSTETFIGTLAVAGAKFCPFTVATAGTASVTLASLVTSGSPVTKVVGLGVGTTTGTETDCTLSTCTLATEFTTPTQFTAAPALTAQISTAVPKGANCVAILDTGNLTVPLDFAIRVVHP